jgi:hypothetical protein
MQHSDEHFNEAEVILSLPKMQVKNTVDFAQ